MAASKGKSTLGSKGSLSSSKGASKSSGSSGSRSTGGSSASRSGASKKSSAGGSSASRSLSSGSSKSRASRKSGKTITGGASDLGLGSMNSDQVNVNAPGNANSNRADAGEYEGNDIATGSQTPEGVTNPDTDIFDSGVAGGVSTDNGNAGS